LGPISRPYLSWTGKYFTICVSRLFITFEDKQWSSTIQSSFLNNTTHFQLNPLHYLILWSAMMREGLHLHSWPSTQIKLYCLIAWTQNIKINESKILKIKWQSFIWTFYLSVLFRNTNHKIFFNRLHFFCLPRQSMESVKLAKDHICTDYWVTIVNKHIFHLEKFKKQICRYRLFHRQKKDFSNSNIK